MSEFGSGGRIFDAREPEPERDWRKPVLIIGAGALGVALLAGLAFNAKPSGETAPTPPPTPGGPDPAEAITAAVEAGIAKINAAVEAAASGPTEAMRTALAEGVAAIKAAADPEAIKAATAEAIAAVKAAATPPEPVAPKPEGEGG